MRLGNYMPFTPFHYPVAYLISKTDRRLSLPGLIVGAVIPDIEVPLMWVFFSTLPDHYVLHSLLGALTIGTVTAIIVTRFLYAPIISLIFGVDKALLDEECKLSTSLVVSCFIGALSHILLDVTMHWYNPVFWPWIDPFAVVGPLVSLFAMVFGFYPGYIVANLAVTVVMGIIWIGVYLSLEKGTRWERMWASTKEEPLF
jgi:membrane-bound metal-dependent hydrolase YbcI (DUF457 family)